MNEPTGYLLKRAQMALRLEMDRQLAPLALSSPQYAALLALHNSPEASNADLARLAFVTPQSMNRLVLQLEKRGLLTRHAHPTHGRILQAVLTPRGERLLESGRQAVADVEKRLVRPIPARERERFKQHLLACAESLEGSM